MTMQEQCVNFLDELASIVDGDEGALDRHLDHLSECDGCRDVRHEADRVARSTSNNLTIDVWGPPIIFQSAASKTREWA